MWYFVSFFGKHCYGSWVLSACTSRQVVHLCIAKCLPPLSLLASIVVLVYTFFLWVYSSVYDWYIDCKFVIYHEELAFRCCAFHPHFIIINIKILLFPKNIHFGICFWRKFLPHTYIQQLVHIGLYGSKKKKTNI